MTPTHLPVDTFNANLRSLGRDLAGAHLEQRWLDGEFGLRVTWADGVTAFIGFGPMVTAIIESIDAPRH